MRDGREHISPEFEECKRLSLSHNLPLPEVYRRIERDLSGG